MLQLAPPSTGEPVRTVGAPDGAFTAVAFAPDGTLLAAGTRAGSIHLWALAFSADGKSLASGGHDQTVRVWEVPTGKERLRLDGHAGGVFSVAFAPDGLRLASGGADGNALLRDLRVAAR